MHYLRIVILAVTLAVFVNLAVAWGCALWSSPISVVQDGPIHDRIGFGFAERGVYTEHEFPPTLGLRSAQIEIQLTDGFPSETFDNPQLEQGVLSKHYIWSRHPARILVGWPLLCMIHDNSPQTTNLGTAKVPALPEYTILSPQSLPESTVLDLPPASRGLEVSPALARLLRPLAQRRFPIQPLWPAFAFNTLLYAAFISVFLLMPRAVHRCLRRYRRRCPSCGYLRGSSQHCSECGNPLAPRGVRSRLTKR